MAPRTPKAKFFGTINFSKPRHGIGSRISYSSDSIDDIKTWLQRYAPGRIRIFENKMIYPSFDWHLIESYETEK